VKKLEIAWLLCLYLAIVAGLTVLLFATRSDLMPNILNALSGLYRYWAGF
jgi:hypothetical protein